jgi:hypothetical protein
MRFPIDVVFLVWPPPESAGAIRVLGVREAVRAFRSVALPLRGRPVTRASIATLELPDGRAASLGIAPDAALREASP